MTDNSNEIADLKRQLAALTPTPSDSAGMNAWRDEMHQLSERRMNHASNFSSETLREMERACPTSAVQDIARHGSIPPPSISAPTSQQVTSTRSNAGMLGSNTGWVPEQRFGSQPGIRHVDALVAAQDERDTAERIRQEVAMQAVQKALKDG